MPKHIYSLASAALLFTAAFSFSCQKQQGMAARQAQKMEAAAPQHSEASLVAAMSSDVTVSAYVLANEEMLSRYEKWYDSLSETERRAWDAKHQAGSPLTDAWMQAQQRSSFRAAQQARAERIKSSYGQLDQLSSEEKSIVWAKVARQVLAKSDVSFVNPES